MATLPREGYLPERSRKTGRATLRLKEAEFKGGPRMTGTAKRNASDGAEKTTEVLDEFRRAYVRRTVKGTVTVLKAKRTFGHVAYQHIARCMAIKYAQCGASLREEFGFSSSDECVGPFWESKTASLGRAIEDGKITDDRSFDRYVNTAIGSWVNSLFERTERGRKRDVIRSRMSRDPQHRFVNVGDNRWGLMGGNDQPSTVSESKLGFVALNYPVDIDYRQVMDPDRKRDPDYGRKGQLENLLEGVLQAADGTLSLTALLRIAQVAVPLLRTNDTVSMNANPDHPVDVRDVNAVDPSAASEWSRSSRELLMNRLSKYFESLDDAERERQRVRLRPMLVWLLGDAAASN